MIKKTKNGLQFLGESILNSYSQIFFSNNKWFALLLLLSTFADPYTGICGVLAVLFTILFVKWFGFSMAETQTGYYCYNSLMIGLVLGVYFKLSILLLLLIALASLLSLFITIWLAALFQRYKIPFLSVPFLLVVWIMLLSTRNYQGIELTERGIFTINELMYYGGQRLVNFMATIHAIKIPVFWEIYLKSLGAILFQYNLISGLLIALGLLLYSRIAFSLSLIGYATGFLFYFLVEENFSNLIYSYIGFNFILSAIAIGGFFIIPSLRSYGLVILTTPLIAILISAFNGIFYFYQLPMYSLPFNLVVMLILFGLQLRTISKNILVVNHQLFSPEKNLYYHFNRLERFKNDTYVHIHLPFFGEWQVSQGYNGKQTHKGEWKHALDFVVTDEKGNTFKKPGTHVSDYYCYNLPVLAPAAGWVTEIVDNIEDNVIGEVNLENNWGNTIVIKHGEFMYSKLSHLKSGFFKVKVGDYVKKGDIIAHCGSSGRSPEPHLHFQLQATPYIDSGTLPYPIAYYISKEKGKNKFTSFDIPKTNEIVSEVSALSLLKNVFYFIPGKAISFEVNDGKEHYIIKWEIFTNSYNHTYIYCHHSGASAYFVNNGTLLYFTDFYGKHHSLLYYFYLATHKVLLSYYPELQIKDKIPLPLFYNGVLRTIHDFTAPFFSYLRTQYIWEIIDIDDIIHPAKIICRSTTQAKIGSSILRKMYFETHIQEHGLEQLIIMDGKRKIVAKCLKNLSINIKPNTN